MDYIHIKVQDLWMKHGDSEMISFPFLTNPYYYMSLITSIIVFVKVIGPLIMYSLTSPHNHISRSKLMRMDIKPIMLIFNGLMFGFHGAAIFCALAVSSFGSDFFDCSITPLVHYNETIKYSVKRGAYVYIIISLFSDYGKLFFNILRRKYHLTPFKLIHKFIWSSLVLFSGVLWPASLTFFPAFLLFIHRTVYYAYLVLSVSGSDIRPRNMAKLKLITKLTHFMTNVLISTHSIFYGFFTPVGCGNKFLLLSMGVYTFLLSFLLALNCMRALKLYSKVSSLSFDVKLAKLSVKQSKYHGHKMVTRSSTNGSSSSSCSNDSNNNENGIRQRGLDSCDTRNGNGVVRGS